MKILLCPPTYYDIEYEINPWMNVNIKVDKEKVEKQYQDLKDIYRRLSVQTFEISPVKGLPDMVYTANFGIFVDNIFIPSNFKYPQRRKESEIAVSFLDKEFGIKSKYLPGDVFFEGQGDMLGREDDIYFIGWGKRSDFKAEKLIKEIINKEVVSLELVDPYFYHLDTCFSPLSKEIAVINPRAFTKDGIKTISSYFKHIIETSEEDNKHIGCNIVSVENKVILSKGITDKFKKNIESVGYQVIETEMSEYIKGGGSVRCTSFEFE